MRLFVAVDFPDDVKEQLYDIVQTLRGIAQSGNFTKKDNFHLTLAFIGETEKIANVKRAMKQISFAPFSLQIAESIGVFRRSGGDIYWLGVQENCSLETLQYAVVQSLKEFGFSIETRKFVPHLTLGRQVILNEKLPRGQKITVPVGHISLMKSERIKGQLRYTPVFEISAKNLE